MFIVDNGCDGHNKDQYTLQVFAWLLCWLVDCERTDQEMN